MIVILFDFNTFLSFKIAMLRAYQPHTIFGLYLHTSIAATNFRDQ